MFVLISSIVASDIAGFYAACHIEEMIRKLKMPFKVINGVEDKLCPIENLIEWKECLGDRVETTAIEGAGHFPLE